MLPVFPSVTFPNHYSLATGLLPSSHGIVANHFRDPSDPSGARFAIGDTEPKWWRGQPLWETAERQVGGKEGRRGREVGRGVQRWERGAGLGEGCKVGRGSQL